MRRDTSKIPRAAKIHVRSCFDSSPDSDGAHTKDQLEFLKAMDAYKRENRRPFPTWSEVLEVAVALGYRKVAEPTALPRVERQKLKARRAEKEG